MTPLRQGSSDQLDDVGLAIVVCILIVGGLTAYATYRAARAPRFRWLPLLAIGWTVAIGGGVLPIAGGLIGDWRDASRGRQLGEVSHQGLRWTGERPFAVRWADVERAAFAVHREQRHGGGNTGTRLIDGRIVLALGERSLDVGALRETDQRALCRAIVPALDARLSDATRFCERRGVDEPAVGGTDPTARPRPPTGARVDRVELTGGGFALWLAPTLALLAVALAGGAIRHRAELRWWGAGGLGALALGAAVLAAAAVSLSMGRGWADGERYELPELTAAPWSSVARVEIQSVGKKQDDPAFTLVYRDGDRDRFADKVDGGAWPDFCRVLRARAVTVDPSAFCDQRLASGP